MEEANIECISTPPEPAGVRKRCLTAYKFYMKTTIKELKRRYPDRTIILPMVSRLCAQTWSQLDDQMKRIFQIEADHCEADRMRRGLDDYDIPDLPPDYDDGGWNEEEDGDDLVPEYEPPQKGKEERHDNGTTSDPVKPKKRAYVKRKIGSAASKSKIQPEPIEDDIPQVIAILPKPKRRKNKTLPGAPRRPLSAFVWFCKDERGKVRQRNPRLSMGDTSKILGKMWHELEAEVKEKYQNISRDDRLRYSTELEAFKATLMPQSASSSRPSSQAKTETDSVEIETPLEVGLLSIKEEPFDDINDMGIEDDPFGLDLRMMTFERNTEEAAALVEEALSADLSNMYTEGPVEESFLAGSLERSEFEMRDVQKEVEEINLGLRLECDEQLDETSGEDEQAKEDGDE